MALIPLLLVLVSSVSWSLLDLTRKRLALTVSPLMAVWIIGAGQVPPFAVWVALDGLSLTADYALPGALLVVFNLSSAVLFARALTYSPLSLTIPFLSLTPAFATLVSWPLLGELPSALGFVGIGVVVAGALWLNAPQGEGLPGLARAFLRERGCVLMTAVAAIWAVGVALEKYALSYCSVPTHGLLQTAAVVVVLTSALAIKGRLRELHAVARHPGLSLFAAITATLGFAFQLVALKAVLASLVEVIKRAIGLVGSIALGRIFFGEPITPRKLVAVALMALGTAIISFG